MLGVLKKCLLFVLINKCARLKFFEKNSSEESDLKRERVAPTDLRI